MTPRRSVRPGPQRAGVDLRRVADRWSGRSDRFEIAFLAGQFGIARGFGGNQQVGKEPVGLAPGIEHGIGSHLFAKHVADRRQQRLGDVG